VLLPARRGAGQARQRPDAHPRGAGVAGDDRGVAAARAIDEVHVLVKPDRHARALAADQRHDGLGLGLRRGSRPGRVDSALAAPAPGEVAVEVHAARVAAGAARAAVGVGGVEQQQLDARGRRGAAQGLDDRQPRALGAVDAADDQDADGVGAGRLGADAHQAQRPVAHRMADDLRVDRWRVGEHVCRGA